MELLDRNLASTYASWFKALADPSRVQLVELLARAGRPMSVGELVAAMGLAQSTVSQHLKILAEVRFVLAEASGNANLYRINDNCLACFPSAADVVMGRPVASPKELALSIRPMTPEDAEAVLQIYQAGIDGGDATFETQAPTWADFEARRLPDHRLVAVDAGAVVGWVSVSAFSSRPFYAGVVEHSVYVDPAAAGRGVGSALLQALIASTEAAGIWTIHSRIFPENTASLALHAKAGFVVTGVWHRLGCHHGRWRDVVLVERRSSVAGME